jgi:hypothetical protein
MQAIGEPFALHVAGHLESRARVFVIATGTPSRAAALAPLPLPLPAKRLGRFLG